MNESKTNTYKIKFGYEWEYACTKVLKGLKKLGHDIPITGYESTEEVKEMNKIKKQAGLKYKT